MGEVRRSLEIKLRKINHTAGSNSSRIHRCLLSWTVWSMNACIDSYETAMLYSASRRNGGLGREGQGVTICAAVKVRDGLILATDSMSTIKHRW